MSIHQDYTELIQIIENLKSNYRRDNEQDNIYKLAIDDVIEVIKNYVEDNNG